MKVKALIGSEFIEVDPRNVTVTKVEQRMSTSRSMAPFLEAYGYVHGHRDRVFRVAYTNDDGTWQQEGTVHRGAPPRLVMDQINLRIAWSR